jgi:hypothetical protein
MIGARYHCGTEARRTTLGARSPATIPLISGIDYVEILVDMRMPPLDPTCIDIVLVNAMPAGTLGIANIVIKGGVRYPAPRIASVLPEGGADSNGRFTTFRVTLRPGESTDYSAYILSLVTSPDNLTPPITIDGRLAEVAFSFKVDCPSDFDCAELGTPSGAPGPEPEFDYTARDYTAFRRLLLDRINVLVPDFADDTPVDLTITIAEALAYIADHKSYRLDWIGTEGFLSTARSPTSLRRHARLLDYRVGEGVSARTFTAITFTPGSGPAADGMVLEAATPILTRLQDEPDILTPECYRTLLALRPLVFETLAAKQLWQWQNSIAFHTWSDDLCVLAEGARSVTLVDAAAGTSDALRVGDFLVLAETRHPETLLAADARREKRHVVRLTKVQMVKDALALASTKLVDVEWAGVDALPFDLVLQARRSDALIGSSGQACAEACGNIVLADHGYSLPPASHLGVTLANQLAPRLLPDSVPESGTWHPRLDRAELARIAPVDLTPKAATPATMLRNPEASLALPALSLLDDFSIWRSVPDLLASGRFARNFVVETDTHGRDTLRFGDGINGQPPAPGLALEVNGRFARMFEGNLGPDALAHVVLPTAQNSARLRVTNPLPAQGGSGPQGAASIRANAPEAFRVQDRAVTAADYAEMAQRHPEVANAAALIRWTGSWRTVFVHIDRIEGRSVEDDPVFRADMLRHLEHYRLMGFDIAIRGPIPVALDLELEICVAADHLRADVARALRTTLSNGFTGAGARAFFHPDNFTFGTPLYLSALIGAAMRVNGVRSVLPLRFQRFAARDRGELAEGAIRAAGMEILRMDNDPSLPENGRLALRMTGGA